MRQRQPQKSEAAAVYVDPSTLPPWNKNPRHNEAAIDKVAKSIQRFGFASPIVARTADGRVIAGHTRLAAALRLGLEDVPVRFLDIDEQLASALALADNKIGEIATWDDETLGQVLAELEQDGMDLGGLGWDEDELDLIVRGIDAVGSDEWGDALAGLPEGDRAPIQTMTFTLHDDQVEQVRAAMAQAKNMGDYGDTGNENGNGNALSRICETFLTMAASHG